MDTILFWGIALGSTAFIFWPFWQKPQEGKTGAQNGNARLQELMTMRDNILAALKDLEFDFQMGKISQEDYQELTDQYRREAIAVLKRIEAANGANPRLQKIENEIRTLRQQKRSAGGHYCTQCGAPVNKMDRFCSQCGHKLKDE